MKKFLLFLLLISFTGIAFAQYCSPTYFTTGVSAGAMNRFFLIGQGSSFIHDTLPASSLGTGYINRTSTVSAITIQQGRTYTGTVIYYGSSTHTGNQLWIDFNNNNIFDDSEAVSTVFPAAASFGTSDSAVSFTINIPNNASTGTFRLRVRNVVYNLFFTPGYGSPLLNPCTATDGVNQYYNGVTVDYEVNITSLTACAGTPHAGISAGPSSICRNTPFGLTLVNDTVAGNLHYQWYSAPLASGAMSPVSGATNRFYNNSNQVASTLYQAVITCPSSGLHDSSTISAVYQNALYRCYCHTVGGDPYDATLDSVAIAGTSLNMNISHNQSTYIQFPDTGRATTNLTRGITYNLFIKSGGNRKYGSHLWIDYDNNGNFDPGEYLRIDSTTIAGGGTYCSFTIPASADTGLTGLRIRTVMDSIPLAGVAACAYQGSGETEDYIVNILQATNCSGTPSPGTAYSSVPAACVGVPFNISSVGYPLAVGITFQWYSRSSGSGGFTPLTGATGSVFTVASQVSARDYMLKVTCVPSGRTDSSAILTVVESPYYLCYCSPPNGITLNDFATAAPIDSVYIATTSLYNATPGSLAVYTRYYPATLATSAGLLQSNTYTLTLNSNGANNYNGDIWIDYDHSGTFDVTEHYTTGHNITHGASSGVTFTIPALADTGITGLRIRTSNFSYVISGSDACTEEFNGATQDYYIIIGPGAPCAGSPAAGFIAASDSLVCPGTSIYLTDAGALSASGISYQWISRPAGTGAYTPISGATLLFYTIASQAVSTDYTLLATCSFSGITDTAVGATVIENPFYACYCGPLTGSTLNDSGAVSHIDSFFITTTTLRTFMPGDTAIYTQYYPVLPTTTGTLDLNSTYVLGLKADGTAAYKADIWIDYDHSGTFDNSEYIPVTASTVAGGVSLLSLTVPPGADTGFTGLRVRTYPDYYSPTSADACSEFINGTTKDYVITIDLALPCIGTPSAGAITAFNTVVCDGEPLKIVANSFSFSSGTTYQWIKCILGTGAYMPVSGATTPILIDYQSVPNDYAFVATCTTSGRSDTSLITSINMKPFYLCYCSPITGITLNTSAIPAPVDSFAITGTSFNNNTPGAALVYKQYYPTTSATTDSLVRGNTYNLYLNSRGTANYNADIWLDLDQSGVFDTGEYIHVTTNQTPGGAVFATIRIPYGADTGITGLRVRTSGYAFAMYGSDGCTNEYYGATQDYIVRIAPGIPCSGTPAVSVATTTVSTICTGLPFTLTDTGYTVDIGISYQWFLRPAGAGAFIAITGATSPVYYIASQTASTDYSFITTCSGSGLASSSNIVTVNTTPFYSCYCGSPLGTSPSLTQITDVQVHGSALHVTGVLPQTYKVFGMAGDSTGTIQRGLPYPIDLKVIGGVAFNAGMWIDYDHSGSFDPSEYIRLDTNTATGTTSTTMFTIPASVDTGITAIRIRATPATNSLTPADACTNIFNSQTFDFKINIDTLVRCSGTPNAGTITSSSPFACPTMTFQLSNDGYGVGTGLTYQWMKRTIGAYSSISGRMVLCC